MPLMIDGQVPKRWEERLKPRPTVSMDSYARGAECISLALINNMPDSALEDTELQFFELLDMACGDVPVLVKLFSLPGVPRTERGQRHLDTFYLDFDNLWENRFDGVIITGTEPHHSNLRDEPYWALLTEVFDWAERSTNSTIMSCLAAHASVLHLDGIKRHPLPDKQFGVFECNKNCSHELTIHAPERLRFPHSRWNEVRENDLSSSGYETLTKSADAGVDLFVKKTRKSLFVHFQGHPEYGAPTLLKEYRRDIKRFLRGERETHPSMPHGYFDVAATKVLTDFRELALANRRENIIESFPESVLQGLQNSWQSTAICVYQNWLHCLLVAKPERPQFVPVSAPDSRRKQPAVS